MRTMNIAAGVLAAAGIAVASSAAPASATQSPRPLSCAAQAVCLYDLHNYQGYELRLTGPAPKLPGFFDNRTSSVFNNRPSTFCFYRDPGYTGFEFALPRGRGRNLAGPGDNSISSARPCNVVTPFTDE